MIDKNFSHVHVRQQRSITDPTEIRVTVYLDITVDNDEQDQELVNKALEAIRAIGAKIGESKTFESVSRSLTHVDNLAPYSDPNSDPNPARG